MVMSARTKELRAALERENAILAAKKCTPLDAAELWMIIARSMLLKMRR